MVQEFAIRTQVKRIIVIQAQIMHIHCYVPLSLCLLAGSADDVMVSPSWFAIIGMHGSVLQVALFSCGLDCQLMMDQASLLAYEVCRWCHPERMACGIVMHNVHPPTYPSTHLVCLHCALSAGCPTSDLMWAAGHLVCYTHC